MDEEIYTRESPKESSHRSGGRRVEPENVTSEKAHSDKLKNETTAGESYRKKLRHGKKDNRITKEEAKKARQRKKQGRAKIYKDAAIAAKARQTVIQNEDNNSGTDSLNACLATI